ncbi:hypothetical protein D9M70_508210 [compost metagenome]
MQAPGQRPLRDTQLTRDLVGQFLQGAERAEPAAISSPSPEQERCGNGEPQDEGKRVEQKSLPAEAVDQTPEERHQIDDRKLRVGIPAKEDQRHRQEDYAKDVERPGVPDRIGLEEEHRRQHNEHGAQHDNLQLRVVPDAFPQIGLCAPLVAISNSGNFLCRRGDSAQVLLRKLISQIECMEDLFDRSDLTLRQELNAEGLCRIEAEACWNAEQVHLVEFRRAGKRDGAETAMVTITKANGNVVLDQHDAIEDAAAHIA